MQLRFLFGGVEHSAKTILEFTKEEMTDFWREPFFHFYSDVDKGQYNKMTNDDRYKFLVDYFSVFYAKNQSLVEDSVGVQGAIRSMKNKFNPLCRYFRSAYVSVRVVQVPKRGLNLSLHDSQTSTAGISALFKADD